MKLQTRDAIAGLIVGSLITAGFALFIQGANPLLYLGFWLLAVAGATQGAIRVRANRRAVIDDEDEEE